MALEELVDENEEDEDIEAEVDLEGELMSALEELGQEENLRSSSMLLQKDKIF